LIDKAFFKIGFMSILGKGSKKSVRMFGFGLGRPKSLKLNCLKRCETFFNLTDFVSPQSNCTAANILLTRHLKRGWSLKKGHQGKKASILATIRTHYSFFPSRPSGDLGKSISLDVVVGYH
jgi:hypothetical protein